MRVHGVRREEGRGGAGVVRPDLEIDGPPLEEPMPGEPPDDVFDEPEYGHMYADEGDLPGLDETRGGEA